MALIGEFTVAARESDPSREPDQFKLNGEVFTVSDRDLTIPFGRFAEAATSGLDTAEVEGLAAMMRLLKAVVVEEDRMRLLDAADGADGEQLIAIVTAVMQAKTGRPTERPSDSSGGLSPIGVNSKAPSSSEASSPLGNVPPIQQDPRVQALQPIDTAALSLVG